MWYEVVIDREVVASFGVYLGILSYSNLRLFIKKQII